METLSEQPAETADYDERTANRLGEIAPNPLMHAAQALRGAAAEHFPNLYRIRFNSDAY